MAIKASGMPGCPGIGTSGGLKTAWKRAAKKRGGAPGRKGAIRTALLISYDKTYDQPMDFTERKDAKDLLDKISNARRKVLGQPHLILPGGDDAPKH